MCPAPHGPVNHAVLSGGLRLAVTEHRPAARGPWVVLLHGYPDDQSVWDGVVAALGDLAEDPRVLTYDARGAGSSDAAPEPAGYLLSALLDDLEAVLVARTGDEPVHLVGHDWGAAAGFDAVADAASGRRPRLAARLASFTSVGGASLDHLAWLRTQRGHRRALLGQRAASWYAFVFGLPRLGELAWTRLQRGLLWVLRRYEPSATHLRAGPRLARTAREGLALYRQNMGPRLRASPPAWTTDLPVRVVVPRSDRFLRPVCTVDLGSRCPELHRTVVDGGHWLPVTAPTVVADAVADSLRAVSAT